MYVHLRARMCYFLYEGRKITVARIKNNYASVATASVAKGIDRYVYID